MKRRSAAPFLQLGEAARVNGWVYELNHGSPLPLGELMPDWDYGATLKVSRTIQLDHEAAAEELQVSPEALELMVLIEIGSGPGTLPREIIERLRLPLARTPAEQRIEFDLPTRSMSTQLSLRMTIALARDTPAANALAPTRQGSRLWSDRMVSRLEGGDPRFPMEVADFNAQFRGRPYQHAPWFLRWNATDLDRDFYSAVRLYLNEHSTSFVQRVQEQDHLTLQMLMGDVISQMCESALRGTDGADRLQNAEEATLGGQIRYWLLRAFRSVPDASYTLQQRPGEFRAAILASVGFDA